MNNATADIQTSVRRAKAGRSFDSQLPQAVAFRKQQENPFTECERRTVVELFAGIGLVHEAIHPLGWTVILANDNDPKKSNAYQANFPDVPFNLADVRRLNLRELPAVQLITASFPCVDLSQAGNREGLNGEHSSLVRTFLDKVSELDSVGKRPEFLLVENVPNLLSIHEGAALDEILHTLAGLNYGFDLVQVDAKHFTPQSRNRVFIIAVDLARHGLNQRPLPSDNLHRHKVRDAYLRHPKLPWFFFDFPALPARELSLGDILEDVPAGDSSWWDKEQMEYFWSLLEHDHKVRLKSVLAAGSNHVFTAVRRLRRRRKREQIFNLRFDGLASCLRTPRGGSSTQYVIVTADGKIQGRRLTGLEAARLQGVCLPDYSPDYKLVGSETDIRFAFGDAVCVPALKWVVEHSIEQLLPTQGVRNGKSLSLQKHLVFG